MIAAILCVTSALGFKLRVVQEDGRKVEVWPSRRLPLELAHVLRRHETEIAEALRYGGLSGVSPLEEPLDAFASELLEREASRCSRDQAEQMIRRYLEQYVETDQTRWLWAAVDWVQVMNRIDQLSDGASVAPRNVRT